MGLKNTMADVGFRQAPEEDKSGLTQFHKMDTRLYT